MRDGKAELVRIDSRGEAHPIGAIASQRLRARAGDDVLYRDAARDVSIGESKKVSHGMILSN